MTSWKSLPVSAGWEVTVTGAPAHPYILHPPCVFEEILRRRAPTRNLRIRRIRRVRDHDPDASTGQRPECVLIGDVLAEIQRQNVVEVELERREQIQHGLGGRCQTAVRGRRLMLQRW